MELYRQRVPACSGKALSNRTGLQAARSLKQHPMQHVLNKDPLPIPHAAFASHCQAAGLGARCLPADASRRSRDNIRQDDPPPGSPANRPVVVENRSTSSAIKVWGAPVTSSLNLQARIRLPRIAERFLTPRNIHTFHPPAPEQIAQALRPPVGSPANLYRHHYRMFLSGGRLAESLASLTAVRMAFSRRVPPFAWQPLP